MSTVSQSSWNEFHREIQGPEITWKVCVSLLTKTIFATKPQNQPITITSVMRGVGWKKNLTPKQMANFSFCLEKCFDCSPVRLLIDLETAPSVRSWFVCHDEIEIFVELRVFWEASHVQRACIQMEMRRRAQAKTTIKSIIKWTIKRNYDLIWGIFRELAACSGYSREMRRRGSVFKVKLSVVWWIHSWISSKCRREMSFWSDILGNEISFKSHDCLQAISRGR